MSAVIHYVSFEDTAGRTVVVLPNVLGEGEKREQRKQTEGFCFCPSELIHILRWGLQRSSRRGKWVGNGENIPPQVPSVSLPHWRWWENEMHEARLKDTEEKKETQLSNSSQRRVEILQVLVYFIWNDPRYIEKSFKVRISLLLWLKVTQDSFLFFLQKQSYFYVVAF